MSASEYRVIVSGDEVRDEAPYRLLLVTDYGDDSECGPDIDASPEEYATRDEAWAQRHQFIASQGLASLDWSRCTPEEEWRAGERYLRAQREEHTAGDGGAG